MRAVLTIVMVSACGGSGQIQAHDMPPSPTATLADEDNFKPTYGVAELQQALIAERGAEATNEKIVAEYEAQEDERVRFAVADLAVRRRFIQSLEACQASGRACPPRLDDPAWTWDFDAATPIDPPLDVPLRFDLDGWKRVAAELHGRACACRTQRCVDSMQVAIDELEKRPMLDVQGDEDASRSVMWARECLYRLRGKVATSTQPRPTDE